jgi:hypothetical protein
MTLLYHASLIVVKPLSGAFAASVGYFPADLAKCRELPFTINAFTGYLYVPLGELVGLNGLHVECIAY